MGPGTRGTRLLVEPDDGTAEVVKAINGIQHTIMVSAYLLSQRRIVRALERSAAQGVAVFVMLDHYPYGIYQQPETMFSMLEAAGVHVLRQLHSVRFLIRSRFCSDRRRSAGRGRGR